MAIALVVLALVHLRGWVAGGRFEKFLEPSFAPPRQVVRLQADRHRRQSRDHADVRTIAVAVAGISRGALLPQESRGADKLAENFSGVHRVLEHKYYVDEIYDAAVVQPIQIVSDDGLWKGVDIGVIDRTVNGVGQVVGGASEVLRLFQTGSVRVYAASAFLGVVVVLGYYLWR